MPTRRFEEKFGFRKRKRDALHVLKKFPSRVPVILQLGAEVPGVRRLFKNKYLVPCDMKVGQFMAVVRSKLFLKPHQALYLITKKKGTMPPTSALMISIYHDNMDDDYFLYLDLYAENTFG